MTEYTTDWENVDLTRPCNRALNIIEPLNFATLLLEISTNIKDTEINETTVRKQFETDLNCIVSSARTVFSDNLANIVSNAIEYAIDD